MRMPLALVESVFDHAQREINARQRRIVLCEDEANALWWEQARDVVAMRERGLSNRAIAAGWINPRTEKPFDEKHVRSVLKAWEVSAEFTPQTRPRFMDVYNEIANPSNRLVHNSGDFEWYTPGDYVDAARFVMGGIDLDPASNAVANTVVQAERFYTLEDDGLAHEWRGRVWMNPPYVNALVTQFAEKLASSVRAGTVSAAIALTNNCTETQWFRTLVDPATAICFPTGRVHFWKPEQATDSPLQGQTVFYFGPAVDRFQDAFGQFGPVCQILSGHERG